MLGTLRVRRMEGPPSQEQGEELRHQTCQGSGGEAWRPPSLPDGKAIALFHAGQCRNHARRAIGAGEGLGSRAGMSASVMSHPGQYSGEQILLPTRKP